MNATEREQGLRTDRVAWIPLRSAAGGILGVLLVLEDDPERIERFAAVLRSLAPELFVRFWRDAHTMIHEAGPLLQSAVLISLDHDLIPEPGAPDPGDGYMVAKWLTEQGVVRPVIVHTSNGERSLWMAGEFDLAGWRHWRVAPLGEDWVESDWRRVVRRLLKKHGQATGGA